MKHSVLVSVLFSAVFCFAHAGAIDFETEVMGVKFKLRRSDGNHVLLELSRGPASFSISGDGLDRASGFSHSNDRENRVTTVKLDSDCNKLYPREKNFDRGLYNDAIQFLQKGIKFPAKEQSREIKDIDESNAEERTVYVFPYGPEEVVTQSLSRTIETRREPEPPLFAQVCVYAKGDHSKGEHYIMYRPVYEESTTIKYQDTHAKDTNDTNAKVRFQRSLPEEKMVLDISRFSFSFDPSRISLSDAIKQEKKELAVKKKEQDIRKRSASPSPLSFKTVERKSEEQLKSQEASKFFEQPEESKEVPSREVAFLLSDVRRLKLDDISFLEKKTATHPEDYLKKLSECRSDFGGCYLDWQKKNKK